VTVARVIDENILIKSLQRVAAQLDERPPEAECSLRVVEAANRGPCKWVLSVAILDLYAAQLSAYGWRGPTRAMQLSRACQLTWYNAELSAFLPGDLEVPEGSYSRKDAPFVAAAAAAGASFPECELVTTDGRLTTSLLGDGIPSEHGFRVTDPCEAVARNACGETP
jgi:hypothetical protein